MRIDIYHGEASEILRSLDSNLVHLTVTSPPYYNARDYASWTSYDGYLKFLQDVFTQVFRVTMRGRMCAVNISTYIEAREKRSKESKRYGIPFHFFNIMEGIGWQFIDDIVWMKPEGAALNRNGGFYQHRKPLAYKPNIVTESILIFKKPADFLIDETIRSYSNDVVEQSLVPGEYERSNVWQINAQTVSDHPAPYPEKLASNLVRYYSYAGDTVLDPFLGSGTTALAAYRLYRNSIGIELHEEYVEMSRERIIQQRDLFLGDA